MKRPLYYLLCAIACTSMIGATMPMAAIAEAMQPQETAEQQAQADATSSDTDKIEETTSSNVTDSSDPTSDTQGNSDTPVDATNATDTPTPATPNPQPSLRAQANSTPEAITTAAETGYAHNVTANQNGVTLTLSWDDAAAGEPTRFHLSATGGSGAYKFRMDAPFYMNPGEGYFGEMVADTSRGQWMTWTSSDTGCDYEFTMTASGRYYYRFYLQDAQSSVWSLRVAAEAEVSDDAHPSIDQIITNAVAQCRQETSGSEYDMALWLHDWTLDQLEYDLSLNWCSAESGLTRHQGTCESYQRIYSKLLNAAGIANGRITGNGHTWNAVKIDGKWCQMDLTWDDTTENWYGDLDQRHLYFGLTDELMAIAHSDHTANYQKGDYAYRSTDLSNNYFVRNGKAAEWAEKYADRIQQHLNAKEESFSIDADNQSFPPSISGIQNGIVAYAMNQQKWSADGESAALKAISNVTTASSYQWSAKFVFEVKYPEVPAPTTDISRAEIYVSDVEYTGLPLTPPVSVRIGNAELTEDIDYTVEYQENITPGEACVIVKGTGNYRGVMAAPFRISATGEIESFANSLYTKVLDRRADPSGLSACVSSINGGTSLSRIAVLFFESEEFSSQNNTNEIIVKRAYRGLLNREPDAGGMAAWTSRLDAGLSVRDLISLIAQSDEFYRLHPTAKTETFIDNMYREVLGREADGEGFMGWKSALREGLPAKELCITFISSKEFESRKMSPTEVIAAAYRAILMREPDTAAVKYGSQAINAGLEASKLARQLTNSDEFKALCQRLNLTTE